MSASSFASLRLGVFALTSDIRSQSRGIPPREGDVQKVQTSLSVRPGPRGSDDEGAHGIVEGSRMHKQRGTLFQW
jgi:hypothetical protein